MLATLQEAAGMPQMIGLEVDPGDVPPRRHRPSSPRRPLPKGSRRASPLRPNPFRPSLWCPRLPRHRPSPRRRRLTSRSQPIDFRAHFGDARGVGARSLAASSRIAAQCRRRPSQRSPRMFTPARDHAGREPHVVRSDSTTMSGRLPRIRRARASRTDSSVGFMIGRRSIIGNRLVAEALATRRRW